MEAGKGSYRVHKRLGWAIQRHPVEKTERGKKGEREGNRKKARGEEEEKKKRKEGRAVTEGSL